MYKILLRDVLSGQKKWYNDCYFAGKLKKNQTVLWKAPEESEIKKYKILAWKWQGNTPKPPTQKEIDILDAADSFLLSLDFPEKYKKMFVLANFHDKMNLRQRKPSQD